MNRSSTPQRRLLAAGLFMAGCLGAGAVSAITPGAASTDSQATRPPSASMQQGGDYGNAADKNKVAPTREAVQNDANRPSTSVLDDNAQRQHDPDQAAGERPSAPTAGTTHDGRLCDRSDAGMDASGSISRSDWDKIDTNRDDRISPQEMNDWLQQHPAQPSQTMPAAPRQ